MESIPQDSNWLEALHQAKIEMEYHHEEAIKAADKLLVAEPRDPYDLIEGANLQLADDDDPEIHRTVRAATRQGPESIMVIMLPNNVPLVSAPTISDVRTLLDRSVKISHRGAYYAILSEGDLPEEWAENAHLRHSRLLRLDEQHQVIVGSYQLMANEELGIEIVKRET